MKRIYFSIVVIISFAQSLNVLGQICDPTTPVFIADLSGSPDSSWISPSAAREGYCCSATSPDKCVEFIVTLDPAARGISFNIASGAVPPGALYYQVDCGTPTAVGQPICLNGTGPFYLTFCKPGNNQNSYSITSFAEPVISAAISNVVSPQCQAVLTAVGSNLDQASLTWSSVPNNATYDSYLSCTIGCDSVTVVPFGNNLPPYVDYQVCGQANGYCDSGYVCDTVRVFLYNDLTVSVSPSNVVLCNGTVNTPVTSSVSGGSGAYQYLWSNGATTSAIIASAGTYTVTVSDPAICSTSSATTTITVVPPATAFAGNDITVCENSSSVNLNGSLQNASGGMWTGGTGTFSPNNTTLNAMYTPSASEIQAGFVNLVLESASNQGCPQAYDTLHIAIAQQPDPVISGNIIMCSGNTGTYSTPFESGSTYTWNVSGGTINGAGNSNAVNITWSASGTASVTVTNNSGCSASTNVNVTVSSPASANAGTDVISCTSQNPISLNGIVQNGVGYYWSGGNGSFNPNNTTLNTVYTPSANEIANGSVNLILVAQANAGCPDSYDTIQITLSETPDASIAGNSMTCATSSGVYNVALQPGCTYSWSVSGGSINGSSNSNSVVIDWGGAGNGSVTVTVTNNFGCTSTTTTSVSISSPALSNAGTDIAVCGGTNPVALNGIVQNATGIQWTGGTGTFSPGNTTLNSFYTPSSAEVQAGTAQLILQASANQGCLPAYDTILISISPYPDASITGNAISCANGTSDFSADLQPGYAYSWSVIGGTINGSSNSNSISVDWGNGGSGSVSVNISNSSGCASNSTLQVSLVVLPNPVFSGTATNCQNTTSQYSVSSSPGSTYSWSVTNGTLVGNSTGSSALVNWNMTGNGNVTVVETNSYGCVQSYTASFTTVPMPLPQISGSQLICSNQTTSTYTAALQSNCSYQWTVSGGSIVSSNGGNSATVQWSAGGANSISLTMTNSYGCDSTTSLPVTFSLINPPSVQSTGRTGCPPLHVEFSGNNPGPGQVYSWSFGDQSYSSSANPDHIFTAPGNYPVHVFTQNAEGCSDSISVMVNVFEIPEASFEHNFENEIYYIGESNLILTNTSVNGLAYQWSFGAAGASQAFEPSVIYEEPGDYLIELTTINSSGCPDRTTREIRVRSHEHIYVPDAFTPNGDNVNDYFSMLYSGIESATVSVFNRWGDNFFTSNDKDFKWDGRYAGNAVESGVYVYRIVANGEGGKQYIKIGTITVIR